MAVNEAYLQFVTDQLSAFCKIDIKRMFGGIGIFHQGLMFGMIAGDVFKLKVDDHNKIDFENKGILPPNSGKKKKGMPYWEVPIDVLENKVELKKWAEKSFEAAFRAKK